MEGTVTRDELAAAIREVPLFSTCSKRQLRTIASTGKVIEYDEGAVIVREGAPGVRFFLVLKGAAVVTVGGRKRAMLNPRDHFGEIALLDGGSRTATVTAFAPMQVFAMTPWDFRTLVLGDAAVAFKLLQATARMIRQIQTRSD